MKKIMSFVLAACLLLPVAANAADYGVYVTPKIGLAIQHLKVGVQPDEIGRVSGNKAVFGGALAVGYDFHSKFAMPIRAELEYAYWAQSSKTKNGIADVENVDVNFHSKGTVGIQSLFANVYYDFHNSTAFTPYVGAGIGLGFVKTKGALDVSIPGDDSVLVNASKTTTNFAWNIGLGCSYAFTDMLSADLAYRYASFGSGKTGSFEGDYFKSSRNSMHQFMLGLRMTF